jgi:hypothetical protein
LVGSLLASVTVTSEATTCGSVTVKGTDRPRPTGVLAGTSIPGKTITLTVTLTVAIGILGALAVAVIVAPPTATPVTGTVTVDVPAVKLTDAGTAATAALLELRLTSRPPAGAGPDSVSVRFCARPTVIAVFPEKTIVALTVTVPAPGP